MDRGLKIGAGVAAVLALGVIVLLSSCAYPVRNFEQTYVDRTDKRGYRYVNLRPTGLPGTLVIITASGGGTRAAALELSVLEGLDRIAIGRETLADKIDILSSVSGGSVTAAYFALHGKAAFADLGGNPDKGKPGFLYGDGIGAILGSGLNPVGLVRLSTKRTERIDLLIDYLDETLFTKNETFGDLLTAGHRPYLILNAADMVEGTPFAFTQSNFGLLCSDLTQTKLSVAVAASAAFPVALSAVTLKDYSPCTAQKQDAHWPPLWVANDAATDWYDNPDRADRGRVEQAYALGNDGTPTAKQYIHLLDGGIADNLGIAEPFRLLTTDSPSPGFLDEIAQGDIKKIVFIVINARSFASSELDRAQATPGVIDMALATVSSGIDRTTMGAAARLRSALSEKLLAEAAARRASNLPQEADNLESIVANSHLLEIDFDAIRDPGCRQAFHNIGTSWTNTRTEVDALLDVGKALLRYNWQKYADMVAAVGGTDAGAPTSEATADVDVDKACFKLDGKMPVHKPVAVP